MSLATVVASFEPGYVLAVMFIVVMAVLKAYLQYRRDLAKELGADVSDINRHKIQGLMNKAPAVLLQKSEYYRNLNGEGRTIFHKKLRMILAEKTFHAREGMELTDEMIILAASAFVQITYGWPKFTLPRFSKVYIYPSVFYNRLLEAMLRGSTSPAGIIRMSWKHLEHGFDVPDDGINLALHELAHAVKISIQKDRNIDVNLFRYLQEWFENSAGAKDKLLKGKVKVLREYAATNAHEFFACAVEVFFENPAALKQELPKVYDGLMRLLNQDPLNGKHAYAPVFDSRIIRKEVKYVKPDRYYESFQWILILGAMCCFGVAFVARKLSSEPLAIGLFIGTIACIGIVRYYRRFVLSGYTDMNWFVVFLCMGWTPLIATIALVLNLLIPVYQDNQVIDVDRIEFVERGVYQLHGRLEGGAYISMRVEPETNRLYQSCQCQLLLLEYYGIFGLKMRTGIELPHSAAEDL